MTISCSIRGVPLITDIYTFVIPQIRGFLDILPKDINIPRGSENKSVTAKIASETSIPSHNFINITDIAIKLLLFAENGPSQRQPSFQHIYHFFIFQEL